MTALPKMRQNPTREGLGVPCSGPLPISEDDPGDHVVEQVTINPLDRMTNQGRRVLLHTHIPN